MLQPLGYRVFVTGEEESDPEDEGYESGSACNRSSRDERSSPAESCSRVCYFGSISLEPWSSDWKCSNHTVYPCGRLVSKIERNDEVAQASAPLVVRVPEYPRLVSKIEPNDEVAQASARLVVGLPEDEIVVSKIERVDEVAQALVSLAVELPEDGRLVSKIEGVDEVAQVSAPLVVELPEEVIMHILARLPFRSLYRLRTVCKKWNSLIYDRGFARVRSGPVVDEPPFCMVYDYTIEGFLSYNPVSHVWHRLPVSFFSFSLPYNRVLAASGSLVFLANGGGDLFVANPINRSERHLPPPLGSGTVLSAHIAIDDMTDHFKILAIMSITKFTYTAVVVHDSRSLARFEVYDSKSHTWEMKGMFPFDIRVSSVVLREGSLYVLALQLASPPISFVFYKICRDESQEGMAIFEKIDIVVPKKKFISLRLSMQGGDFMLVGMRRDHKKTLRWWRGDWDSILDGKVGNVRWLEVQRLPERLRDWFFSEDANACRFRRSCSFDMMLSEGNYTWSCGDDDTLAGCSETIITNVSLGTWCIVPTYPFEGTPTQPHGHNPKVRTRSAYERFLFRPRWDHFV